MSKMIPKASKVNTKVVAPNNTEVRDQTIRFSFERLERNDYFNLDGTCKNWASDLFETLKKVSGILKKDIDNGVYSGHNTPLRIHNQKDAVVPCKIPDGVEKEDLWQIRISVNKGGIHGQFIDNVFYVLWLDPQHNMWPNKDLGGLRKIIPPSTCCKERDEEIKRLNKKIADLEHYEKILDGMTKP